MKREGNVLVILVLVLARWLVGLHSYSGKGTPPMYGDYEAQRHWMEITLNLPSSDWYFNTSSNDLLYWGLDYPPLTAYVSYVFGVLANVVEPPLVALTSSRGYESPTSKAFMRVSVLLCDLVLFIPAVLLLVRRVARTSSWSQKGLVSLVILVQPSLLLIDHGHFQYNNVCLGFTALAVALLWKDQEFLASVSFCLALNFKQMALYYAPAFGVYLLSKCIYRRHTVLHIAKLAVAVIATFALLWYPFCAYPRSGETCITSLGQVLHRVFPFSRGLFEDKVANVWCVADLVLKLRRRITPVTQMRLCTLATFVGFLPSVVDLLRRKPTKFRFLLALINTSLAFFLFSFQVHEKSILLPLLPISVLYIYTPLLAAWFSIVSAFSMFFLLQKDGVLIPYIVLQVSFFLLAVVPAMKSGAVDATRRAPGHDLDGRPSRFLQVYTIVSTVAAIGIHLAHATITAPQRYPHIFDYVFATLSCLHFALALAYCTFWQWTCTEPADQATIKGKTKTE